jgi:hypothetical protein
LNLAIRFCFNDEDDDDDDDDNDDDDDDLSDDGLSVFLQVDFLPDILFNNDFLFNIHMISSVILMVERK